MPLHLYHEPQEDHVYCFGLDPSKGGGRDASALVVLDATLGLAQAPVTEAACFRSNKCDALDLAKLALDLHKYGYRVALGNRYTDKSGGLVPELTGDDAIRIALEACFPLNYWYIQTRAATPNRLEARPTRFGFMTTEATKTSIISQLHGAIETRAIHYSNPWLRDEARYWSRGEGHWRYGLESGSAGGHGDVTIAMALALEGVRAVQEWLERRQAAARVPQEPNAVYMNWGSETQARDPELVRMLEAV